MLLLAGSLPAFSFIKKIRFPCAITETGSCLSPVVRWTLAFLVAHLHVRKNSTHTVRRRRIFFVAWQGANICCRAQLRPGVKERASFLQIQPVPDVEIARPMCAASTARPVRIPHPVSAREAIPQATGSISACFCISDLAACSLAQMGTKNRQGIIFWGDRCPQAYQLKGLDTSRRAPCVMASVISPLPGREWENMANQYKLKRLNRKLWP